MVTAIETINKNKSRSIFPSNSNMKYPTGPSETNVVRIGVDTSSLEFIIITQTLIYNYQTKNNNNIKQN